MLRGEHVVLRPATHDDVDVLAEIRSTPEVWSRWLGDPRPDTVDAVDDPDLHYYVIEDGGRVVGGIQWYEEDDPQYRHAGIDLFLDPAVHGRGLGTETLRLLSAHLIDEHGFHRLVIDPEVENEAAIASFRKVGFKPVGVMRRYIREGPDEWKDGLLMDLLADELVRS